MPDETVPLSAVIGDDQPCHDRDEGSGRIPSDDERHGLACGRRCHGAARSAECLAEDLHLGVRGTRNAYLTDDVVRGTRGPACLDRDLQSTTADLLRLDHGLRGRSTD